MRQTCERRAPCRFTKPARIESKPPRIDNVKRAIREFIAYLMTNEPGTEMYLAWQQTTDPVSTSVSISGCRGARLSRYHGVRRGASPSERGPSGTDDATGAATTGDPWRRGPGRERAKCLGCIT